MASCTGIRREYSVLAEVHESSVKDALLSLRSRNVPGDVQHFMIDLWPRWLAVWQWRGWFSPLPESSQDVAIRLLRNLVDVAPAQRVDKIKFNLTTFEQLESFITDVNEVRRAERELQQALDFLDLQAKSRQDQWLAESVSFASRRMARLYHDISEIELLVRGYDMLESQGFVHRADKLTELFASVENVTPLFSAKQLGDFARLYLVQPVGHEPFVYAVDRLIEGYATVPVQECYQIDQDVAAAILVSLIFLHEEGEGVSLQTKLAAHSKLVAELFELTDLTRGGLFAVMPSVAQSFKNVRGALDGAYRFQEQRDQLEPWIHIDDALFDQYVAEVDDLIDPTTN